MQPGVPISVTCCKKSNSMNILQHFAEYPSNFAADPAPGYTCNILVSQPLQYQKEMLCCQCEYKCPTCSDDLTWCNTDLERLQCEVFLYCVRMIVLDFPFILYNEILYSIYIV